MLPNAFLLFRVEVTIYEKYSSIILVGRFFRVSFYTFSGPRDTTLRKRTPLEFSGHKKFAQYGSSWVHNWFVALTSLLHNVSSHVITRNYKGQLRWHMKFDHRGNHMYFRDGIPSGLFWSAHQRVYLANRHDEAETFGKVSHLATLESICLT